MLHDRDQYCGRTERPHVGDLPHYRVGIVIAAKGHHVRIGKARRHVKRQPPPHAREKVFGRKCRQRMLHQANSRTALASAMAKNSPCEATPNIALPSTSRSSPSATRS